MAFHKSVSQIIRNVSDYTNRFLRVGITDGDDVLSIGDNGGADVNVLPSDTNEFEIITNSVLITATEIEFPDAEEFIVFHQTEDAIVHFSSSASVSVSDPSVSQGEVIRITGRKDFSLYMISASGTVPVFAIGTIKG